MEKRQKNIQDLFAVTAMTQRLMHTYIYRTFEELGVAPPQLHLLQIVEQTQPISLKGLADAMRVTPGAITQIVESLVSSGYINRTASELDRRVSVVTLSDTGRDKIRSLSKQKKTLLAKVVADLSDEELQVYLHAQQKMLKYLEISCRNQKTNVTTVKE